jgi:hypothetical protein
VVELSSLNQAILVLEVVDRLDIASIQTIRLEPDLHSGRGFRFVSGAKGLPFCVCGKHFGLNSL